MPIYKELSDMPGVQYIAGGATQNSIRVAQWMLGEAGLTAYMGCIGKDAFGTQLKDCAKADGVVVHYMEDEEVRVGGGRGEGREGGSTQYSQICFSPLFAPRSVDAHWHLRCTRL